MKGSLLSICAPQQNKLDPLEAWAGTMMNSVIARKAPPECRDDEQSPLERAMPLLPVAVTYRRHGLAVAPSLTPTPPRDAEVETKSLAGMPATMQLRLPKTNPNQPYGRKASATDPALVAPVIASSAEVLRARELREQLKKRYSDRPSQPCSLWCVGID
jgi:hypothetical protein